ncbi:hypothetical protein QBC33DRAFT_459115 [Phialemonium atrogriseum]|uniref:Chitin synthase activator n=1 Tax=Phialemonium atrogriseum TaxID=1093897 RepID=A0AAJ0BS79_9PEZI|nr:uncharacterized protein QBC33DRAFT_459115 [Phialemonium atrogriseum]KAK1763524.1 hypothetical protein QBC33DRAFT_459115 [Phialemonium atrogriseum]
MNGVSSPTEAGYGSAFPTFPGRQRKTDLGEEQQILDQMGAMDISGQGPPQRRQNSMGSQRDFVPPPGDRYGGRPPMDGRGPPQGYPPQGYPDQRRGPPGPPGPGYRPPMGYQNDNFGPPERSMTAPMGNPMGMRNPAPPVRNDSASFSGPPGPPGPPGRGMPQRPNTAQAMRPPPQRMYPPNGGPPLPDQTRSPGYDNSPSAGYGGQQRPASFDEFYDYYDAGAGGDYAAQNPPQAVAGDGPDFDRSARARPRNSFDQNMGAAPQERAQRGPGRVPEVSRTKSQPDLRQPQAAIFEMAGDIPAIPTQYQQPGYQGGQSEGQRAYDQPGLPPVRAGLPNSPAPFRPGAQPPHRSSSDGLPLHPAPVRPGLMPNSLVNLNSKPAPVRNYNPGSSGPPPGSTVSSTAQVTPPPPASIGAPPPAKPEAPPVTVDELERLRAMVKADSSDQASALLLAKKLVEASDVLAPNVPDPKARARSRDRYLLDAQKILKKLAGASNPDAMFFMADCFGRGLFGAEADNKEAFLLYQSAAKLGHAAAAYRTAVCCEIGHEEGGGTRKDPLKAIQWYKRAATLGDTPAMYKVGMILIKGLLGQPKNPREAVGWLKRAAERATAENPHALHELGLLYESAAPNDAIVRDESYAFQLFKQAADLGYKFSQFRLGCAYEYGLMGCPVDPRLSIMWYSRAATQEEHQSELSLSGWYLTGSEGVLQQSDTEAYLWARKAAMAGLAKAEYAMGYFTEVGIGVPANLEDAKRWYWRAAAQDFPKARERLEDLKRSGKNGPRQRERISRSKIGKQQEGECSVM